MNRDTQSTAGEPHDIDLRLALGERGGPPHQPVDDQRAVMASYFEETGRVVVDASAGTGKTTTLVVTLAETIVRTASETDNPLSDILVTTFGRDATAELKTRLKRLLRHHDNNGGGLPQDVFRWIETESNIQTLDSLFADLLREVAIEATVPPDFSVDDRLELQRLREEIVADLRQEYRSEFRTLEEAYPAEEWREYPPETVEEMLASAQQNCREFGISTADAAESLQESLGVGHGGEGGLWADEETTGAGPDSIPPETVDDITAVLRAVVGEDAELSVDAEADAQQLLEHVRATYFETAAAIDAFATLLGAYEREYDSRTRRAGQFTFTDVAHLLSSYLDDCEPTAPFRQTLGRRFDHVFVDEFQDTSAVQCAVLRRLVDPEGESVGTAEDGSNLFLIGDSKQAIYEWRSADPALFAEIIETTRAAAPEPATIPHLDVSNVRYHALTTVFRHHPDIAAAANHVFQRLLEDEGRGAIGGSGPSYVPVDPYGSPWETTAEPVESEVGDDSHIHVLNVGRQSEDLSEYIAAADWAAAESTRVAETIAAITDPNVEEPPVTIPTAGDDDDTGEGTVRQPTPGDITLLFRSTRQMQQYATTLRDEYDIAAEAVATGDLFDQPEIELLIDLLSWIARPYGTDLRRLLRSPLVALSDKTIRTVVAADAELETLLGAWPESLPADDRQRLAGLVSLRDDLSWERERSKTALIHRLLQHSGLDGILLSDSDGLRRYGNVWLLTELVDDWEVDELLSYREFRSRLQQLRHGTDSSDPQFSVADVTDGERGDAVTLTTVHQAKGQEYPIVFLCDLPKPSNYPRLQHDRLVMSRQHGFALRPRPGTPPSPGGVDFPTPDAKRSQPVWFNDEMDSTAYPDATGPIWLSDARTESGEFRYPNPLNAHLKAHEAEFWRLAYVAFTRAEDHVFLGLGDLDTNSDYYDQARWTTWLAAFNETLAPDAGWDLISDRELANRTISQDLSWSVTPDQEISETVPIGVDEIPPHAPESAPELDLLDELSRLPGTGDEIDTQPYRPRTVSASSLATLDGCPRAFQYRHVQAVEAARQPSRLGPSDLSKGSTQSAKPPGDLAPNEWGDIVHRAIELRLGDSERVEEYIKDQPEPVESQLRTVVAAVESAWFFEQCQSSAEWVTEYDLSHLVSTEGRDLRVTGTVDLLYRANGGWQLVDWKTGRQPADGAAAAHIQQLSVYGWLLKQQFGITVDTATLAYMDPDGEPVLTPVVVTDDLDTEGVDRTVESTSDAIPISSEDGLETRPDPETCGSCPYAASVGGPCMDDYHATDGESQ
jgi:ATP-dependent helicase/nuclease subunit A